MTVTHIIAIGIGVFIFGITIGGYITVKAVNELHKEDR